MSFRMTLFTLVLALVGVASLDAEEFYTVAAKPEAVLLNNKIDIPDEETVRLLPNPYFPELANPNLYEASR